MTDEKYTFVQDVREKKVTGYSASKRRTRAGKRGRVHFPSDNLTKKELRQMSGECKSYRLNEPMNWDEFRAMPVDIQVIYIRMIREKFHCSDSAIARMMGISQNAFSTHCRKYLPKISPGRGTGNQKYDKEGFLAWCHGVPVAEKTFAEEVVALEEELLTLQEEPAVEEVQEQAVPEPKEDTADNWAIPKAGNMIFEGLAQDVLKTVAVLLGGANVRINLTWTMVED